MTRVLRLLALAIAIAGAADPAITISGASRARVALVALDPTSGASASIRERLARDLSSAYEVVPAITSDIAAAVVIGVQYPDEPQVRSRFGTALPDALLVTTVTTSDPSVNGTQIVRIEAPREVPPATAIHVDVEIASRGMAGQTTDAIVTIAGLEVGRASHKWTAAAERWRASVDAVPVGDPPYVLQVRLKPDTTGPLAGSGLSSSADPLEGSGLSSTADPLEGSGPSPNADSLVVSGFSRTAADVVVGLRRDPIRVEFYDPRPSWAATFVRRALEADPRFQIATLSSTSRGISTRAGEAVALNDPRLDTFDTVVIGGLDRLSAADTRALDRYMRERGGTVVLLPDQRIDNGPARDLLGPAEAGHYQADLAERLLEQPAKLVVAPSVAAPQASELLVFRALPPAADVVARVPGDAAPVIVSLPRGEGRLLLSGAMDAWRYRAADNGAFDRFWQSTIAGLALTVPRPIDIDVDPPLIRPGQPGTVTARLRSRDVVGINASIDGEPLRLVPAAEAGVYRGEFVARPTAGRSTIEVRAERAAAPRGPALRETRALLVHPEAQTLQPASTPSLSLLAQSHHGIDVTPDRVSELKRFLRGAINSPRVPLVRHPMQSTWWIVPFAFCLSAEWWLRRRRGLR